MTYPDILQKTGDRDYCRNRRKCFLLLWQGQTAGEAQGFVTLTLLHDTCSWYSQWL